VKASGDDYREGARGRQATYAARQKKRGFKEVKFWLKAAEIAPMRAHLLELRARGAGGGKIPPLSIFLAQLKNSTKGSE